MPSESNDLLSPAELLAQYVTNQALRIEQGDPTPDLGSEVVLHDASAAQAIDARLAWDEAMAALKVGRPGSVALPALSAVPEWKTLVATQEPALDLAFCTGNFPQMVRNLSLLLQAQMGSAVSAMRSRPCLSSALVDWSEAAADKPFPQPLIAAGLMRLAQDFDRAAALLKKCAAAPAEWRAAVANEEAALAWHAGRRAEARDLWLTRGDDNHVPTLFNRGMAALFLGKPADARASLAKAVAGLPEDNSWHHLAKLYLTLAEMRA